MYVGYYANGTEMTLVAICRPRYANRPPEIVDLIKVNLRKQIDRLNNLIRMINFCSLMAPLTTIIGSRNFEEFVPLRR
jgi:hypothetical protein